MKNTQKPIKRKGYVRIFKDQTDIDKEPSNSINQINYMTFKEFKENVINEKFLDEKPGIAKVSKEHFKKTNKIIRFLKSQISYRLLNFILYSHLFFSNIMNKGIINYLPDDIDIIDVLEEDWNQLKKALGNRNIKVFMNCIFKELTDELIKCKEISEIKDLFDEEETLEKIILNSLEKYDAYEKENNYLNLKLRNVNLDSISSLLNESFHYTLYKEDLYPFYKYFLFTEYISEDNIKVNNNEDYMILYKYINKNKYEKEINHLETLDLYNKFMNLMFETYNNKITRKEAEVKKLNEERVYEENRKLCSDFFKRMKNINENLNLKENDVLKNFLIDKNTDESEKFIDIYKKYIEEQNSMIRDILSFKHNEKGLPISEEINIQNIEKEEIFSFKLKNT